MALFRNGTYAVNLELMNFADNLYMRQYIFLFDLEEECVIVDSKFQSKFKVLQWSLVAQF